MRYGSDIDGTAERILEGTFYMSEWMTPSNGKEATFTARDLIEFMSYSIDITSYVVPITVMCLDHISGL